MRCLRSLYRHAAVYVHKVLRGATPADLPVEQPTVFERTIVRRLWRSSAAPTA